MPQIRPAFIRAHGMLAVIELLQQFQHSREVVSLLLRIVNLVRKLSAWLDYSLTMCRQILSDDPESLEKICLCGGCPVVMSFASNKHPREIRLEAALFIGSMCQTSLLTVSAPLSLRRASPDCASTSSYKCSSAAVASRCWSRWSNRITTSNATWCGVRWTASAASLTSPCDCCSFHVRCRVDIFLRCQGPTPRSEFCRIFAREGLLEPLSEALLSVADDADPLAVSAKERIVHIFLLFSQGDARVKESLLTRPITLRMPSRYRKDPL